MLLFILSIYILLSDSVAGRVSLRACVHACVHACACSFVKGSASPFVETARMIIPGVRLPRRQSVFGPLEGKGKKGVGGGGVDADGLRAADDEEREPSSRSPVSGNRGTMHGWSAADF